MSTIYKSTVGFFKTLSESTVAALIGVVLLAVTLVIVFAVDNGYTTRRTVDATVTAKLHGAAQSRSGISPYFMLAVRHADGTEQDIRTNFVHYSKTVVGGTTQVSVSDYSLGRDMSLKFILVFSALILSMTGFVLAFFVAMATFRPANTMRGAEPQHA